MNDNIFVSVVIPTFNRQKTITHCLNSVLSQTYRKIEVIVIDDCSTDNTVSIVKSYPDPRVRCIVLEKNSGAQAARNRGIIEAKSDWIAFQDSDDEWLPEKLEKQVEALVKAGCDPWSVVHCDTFLLSSINQTRTVKAIRMGEDDNQYAGLLASPGPLYQAMLVSKLALEKIGFLDEDVPSHQEWETSIRLAKHCKFVHINKPLLIYHVGGSSAISGDSQKNIEGWDYIISKHEAEIKEFCGEETWHKLVIQLLQKCLNFKRWNYYDRYRNRIGLSDKDILRMVYLITCRKLRIKPDNIVYRCTAAMCHVLKKTSR